MTAARGSHNEWEFELLDESRGSSRLLSLSFFKYICFIYRSLNDSSDLSIFDSISLKLIELNFNIASELTVLGDFKSP